MARANRHKRQAKFFRQARVAKHQLVLLRVALACDRPGVEVRELDAQHRGLQRVKPAVEADDFVKVSALFAVHAQHVQAARVLDIVCHQHPAVARAAQIF